MARCQRPGRKSASAGSEEYIITFRADDRNYTYTTRNLDEYLALAQGGQYVLTINGFGQITSVAQR